MPRGRSRRRLAAASRRIDQVGSSGGSAVTAAILTHRPLCRRPSRAAERHRPARFVILVGPAAERSIAGMDLRFQRLLVIAPRWLVAGAAGLAVVGIWAACGGRQSALGARRPYGGGGGAAAPAPPPRIVAGAVPAGTTGRSGLRRRPAHALVDQRRLAEARRAAGRAGASAAPRARRHPATSTHLGAVWETLAPTPSRSPPPCASRAPGSPLRAA